MINENKDAANEGFVKPTVDFVAGDQTVSVKLSDIGRFYSDLDKYNDQFSMGAMLARALRTTLNGDDESQFTSDEESSQQTTAFFVISAHKGLTTTLGLSLRPVSDRGATMFHSGDSVSEGEMSVEMSERPRFVAFLHALDQQNLEQSNLRSLLEKIAHSLTMQIHDLRNATNSQIQDHPLFTDLDVFIEAYEQLGLSEQVAKLKMYNTHREAGDLREYLAVQDQGLLQKPGEGFGPADWQKDTTPRSLENKWADAIELLIEMKKNPNAVDLYATVKAHLETCVDTALDSMPPGENNFKTVLEAQKQTLSMLDTHSNFIG